MMTRTLALLVLVAAPAGAACQATDPPDVLEAAEGISVPDLRSRLSVIAHDSMKGRDTPSPGLDMTAAWIVDQFRSFGLRPGVDGSFVQRYSIERVRVDMDASSARVVGGAALRFGEDLGFPFGPGVTGDFEGPVVVVSGSQGWREALGDLDVGGKHVVLVSSPGRDGAWAPTARRMARAFRRGATPASVIVASDRSDGAWRGVIRRQEEFVDVTLGAGPGSRAPTFEIRDRSLAPLLEARGISLAEARAAFPGPVEVREVPGLILAISPRSRVLESAEAPNVVAVLPGSDPELRDEYVLYSAHMDHVGTGPANEAGDSIYNGADDDGSGTVTVVEVAQALSQLETAPRRSVMFLLVSGEEKGLWGSEYFADHPTVPMEQIVANLNVDMVGRNWEDTIVAIGKEHSDLGATLESVNTRHPELNMSAIDDLWPEESFYTRSDHFNFAKKGVPILFFFNGTHEDYHGLDDEVDRIGYDKMARIGRLLFFLGLEVANRDAPPEWDPGSYRAIVAGGG